jgi:rare lipoprotein A
LSRVLRQAEVDGRSTLRVRWILPLLGFLSGVLFVWLTADLTAPPIPEPKPVDRVVYTERGRASWYGPGFHGRRTASGVRFDQNALTAAHRRLPLGSLVTVTNLENGRSVRVAINDRGPYVDGRVIDLSRAAARRLGMIGDGVVRVRIEATRRELATAARPAGGSRGG